MIKKIYFILTLITIVNAMLLADVIAKDGIGTTSCVVLDARLFSVKSKVDKNISTNDKNKFVTELTCVMSIELVNANAQGKDQLPCNEFNYKLITEFINFRIKELTYFYLNGEIIKSDYVVADQTYFIHNKSTVIFASTLNRRLSKKERKELKFVIKKNDVLNISEVEFRSNR